MKSNIKDLTIFFTIFFLYCEKELNISEFIDDYNLYISELRIEALILPNDTTAIVRIDRSFQIVIKTTLNTHSFYLFIAYSNFALFADDSAASDDVNCFYVWNTSKTNASCCCNLLLSEQFSPMS